MRALFRRGQTKLSSFFQHQNKITHTRVFFCHLFVLFNEIKIRIDHNDNYTLRVQIFYNYESVPSDRSEPPPQPPIYVFVVVPVNITRLCTVSNILGKYFVFEF